MAYVERIQDEQLVVRERGVYGRGITDSARVPIHGRGAPSTYLYVPEAGRPRASLSFWPASTSVNAGATVTLDVRAAIAGGAASVVDAHLSYPAGTLTYAAGEVDTTSWTAASTIRPAGAGRLHIHAVAAKPVERDAIVAHVTFRAAGQGIRALGFHPSTSVTGSSRQAFVVSTAPGQVVVAPAPPPADGATLSLTPSAPSVTSGSEVVVEIRATVQRGDANAVEADLSYPADKLRYEGLTVNSGVWSTTAVSDGSNGVLELHVGASGPVTGDQLVATVRFTAIGQGAAGLTFAPSSYVISERSNDDILSATSGTTITVE